MQPRECSPTFWGDCPAQRKPRGKHGDILLAQIQRTEWKIIQENSCRITNCPTRNHICQHKQRTANRTIPKGTLQNHRLPYKWSKRGIFFDEPPLATKKTENFTFRLHSKPGYCAKWYWPDLFCALTSPTCCREIRV